MRIVNKNVVANPFLIFKTGPTVKASFQLFEVEIPFVYRITLYKRDLNKVFEQI